jgi:hypothetical protein
MPPIKITLNRLIELFGRSVNSDLPEPVRALAARLMTLTAHVIRIEQAVITNVKNISTLTDQVSTLAEVVQTLANAATGGAPETQPTAPQASTPTETTTALVPQESEEEDPFVTAARAEAAAEVEAINASQPEVPPVVVLQRSKKVGGVK